jgi:hypothetical protein
VICGASRIPEHPGISSNFFLCARIEKFIKSGGMKWDGGMREYMRRDVADFLQPFFGR